MVQRGKVLLRVIASILVTFVIVYMGFHLLRAFDAPVQTVMAVEYIIEDVVPANGYFVRQEELVPLSGGILNPSVMDGERVAKGDIIANAYADKEALTASVSLRQLERRIEDMKYAKSQSTGALDTLHMDKLIFARLADMLEARDKRQQGEFEQVGLEFKSLVFKREFTYGEGGDLSAQLAALEAQAINLRAAQTGLVSPVVADQSGTFTTRVDGFETTLRPDMLQTLTPATFAEIPQLRDPTLSDLYFGKLTPQFTWWHVLTIPEAEAKRLAVGKPLRLRFADVAHSVVRFTIVSISPPEQGKVVLVLTTNYNMTTFINLRELPSDVILQTYEGLRVPKHAVWQNDETKAFGVYCYVGNRAAFKPIQILTEKDNYYLVAFNPEEATSGKLLPGDSMIVSAKDMYDGKVMQS